VRDCPECGGPVESRFHYCPWCSAPQRRKLVEFFRPHAAIEADHGKALRVSRYFGVSADERHVRFSVWNESGEAEAAVSLGEDESQRLAGFIRAHGQEPPERVGLLARFRAPAVGRPRR
jgi:hypothetical protein